MRYPPGAEHDSAEVVAGDTLAFAQVFLKKHYSLTIEVKYPSDHNSMLLLHRILYTKENPWEMMRYALNLRALLTLLAYQPY
jgi:hypothetical protein